jgi:demethylmenaquinone methyltransferase/2-methoxy-6-polyprenyl-1,4-benzoquinol methylase
LTNEPKDKDFKKETDFGFLNISPSEKTAKVRAVFDHVASQYDLMNDLMSAGLHRAWKNQFVDQVSLKPDVKILDVAGGTGDIASRLWAKLQKKMLQGTIIICDINERMLQEGKDRALNNGLLKGIEWVCGNAERLPFPSNSMDVYTIAFGLRNVTYKETALQEAFRVLKPGGQFLCLEFSCLQDGLLAPLYDLYSFKVLPMLGKWVTGNGPAYQYLAESIRRFPNQTTLKGMMEDAGFSMVSYQNLFKGLTAIHQGWKKI